MVWSWRCEVALRGAAVVMNHMFFSFGVSRILLAACGGER
jgi:hypothetical protein